MTLDLDSVAPVAGEGPKQVRDILRPTGPVPGMDKKPHSGFSGTTTISRTAFGIATKFPTAVVGDEVKLTIDLDVAKQ